MIVFDGVDSDKAETIWNRIKSAYNKINSQENRPYLISVSHGIATSKNNTNRDIDDLIKEADEKMYQEKRKDKIDLNVIREN